MDTFNYKKKQKNSEYRQQKVVGFSILCKVIFVVVLDFSDS